MAVVSRIHNNGDDLTSKLKIVMMEIADNNNNAEKGLDFAIELTILFSGWGTYGISPSFQLLLIGDYAKGHSYYSKGEFCSWFFISVHSSKTPTNSLC